MWDALQAIILGVVQGLTEFLPVSSSGHLELVKVILGNDEIGAASILMTVVLHFATALSTIVVFRKDVLEIITGLFSDTESRNFAIKIIVSMIPAAIVGVLFEDQIDSLFTNNILLVCCMLLVTASLLFVADKAKTTDKGVSFSNALLIGISQAVAIMPGISRSGATISTSVLLGVDREKAARFSFLMVVPLIFGKIAKDLLDGEFTSTQVNFLDLGLGFAAAFFTGLLACTWMIKLVKNSQLKHFAYYCVVVAIIGIVYVFAAG